MLSDRKIVRRLLEEWMEISGISVPKEELAEDLERLERQLELDIGDTRAFEMWVKLMMRRNEKPERIALRNIEHIEAGGKYLSDALYHRVLTRGRRYSRPVQELIDRRAKDDPYRQEDVEAAEAKEHNDAVREAAMVVFTPKVWKRSVMGRISDEPMAHRLLGAQPKMGKWHSPEDKGGYWGYSSAPTYDPGDLVLDMYVETERPVPTYQEVEEGEWDGDDLCEYLVETFRVASAREDDPMEYEVRHERAKLFKVQVKVPYGPDYDPD